jgi:cell division protein FtsZ
MQMIKKELSFKNITVIGTGGAGGNIISHLYTKEIEGIKLITINTDTNTKAHKIIQLSVTLTQNLGTNMSPSLGRKVALENYEDIKTALEDTDMLFLVAGLGGGTGSGVTSVVAKIAKEMGIMVISIVTKPFSFEGKKKVQIAELGLADLKKHTDSLIVISNDDLLHSIDKTLKLREVFEIIDNTISEFISNILEALYSNSDTDINLSFEDLQSVFKYKGISAFGISEKCGENSVEKAIDEAIEFLLFDNVDISNAMCILIILKIYPDYKYISIITPPMNNLNF